MQGGTCFKLVYEKGYFYHRSTWDVQKQAKQASEGEDSDEGEDDNLKPAIKLHLPERARLAKIPYLHTDLLPRSVSSMTTSSPDCENSLRSILSSYTRSFLSTR